MKRIFIGLLVFCITCWTVAGLYYAGREIIFFKNMDVINALITLIIFCAGKNITDVYFYNATNHVSILYGFIIYALIITGFIILGILFYQINTKSLDTNLKKYSVVGLFSSIPTLMILENNMVDWILLSSMIIVLVYATYMKIKNIQQDIELVTLVVFCWLTMSWGGYVGAISIVLYVSFRSFFNNELNFLFEKSNDLSKQIPQVIIMTLLPLVIWYTWWAALGQIGGFYHPRDVDPGSLYLNGGYIGDRFSPSNSWVGFMGGGPAAAPGRAGGVVRPRTAACPRGRGVPAARRVVPPGAPALVGKHGWRKFGSHPAALPPGRV